VNNLEFAILLASLLFGGHAALHQWDVRSTRRAMLQRACRAPECVVRAWLESQTDDGAPQLLIQFAGGQPYVVAQGSAGCAEAATRLRAAGIKVDASAIQQTHPPPA
jgi:hypothetical protein